VCERDTNLYAKQHGGGIKALRDERLGVPLDEGLGDTRALCQEALRERGRHRSCKSAVRFHRWALSSLVFF